MQIHTRLLVIACLFVATPLTLLADQPLTWQIDLVSGGRVVGTLENPAFDITTEFGNLRVGVDRLDRVTPGLASRPEEESRVLDLIADLAHDKLTERDAAERELKTYGSQVRLLLEAAARDADPERRARSRRILAGLWPVDTSGRPWPREDVIEAGEQRITGRLAAKTLTVIHQHGKLKIPLADIEHICTAARRKIDLLKEIDLTRDAVAGTWQWDKGVLVSPPYNRVRVQVPVAPPPSYVLDLVVVPEKGRTFNGTHRPDSFFIGLVVGGRQCYAAIDAFADIEGGPFSGLDTLDGKRAHIGPMHRGGGVLTLGKEANIRCEVGRDRVSVSVDGKLLFGWKGDVKQLGVDRDWRLGDVRFLGVGTHKSIYRIRKFDLTPIDEPRVPKKISAEEWLVGTSDGTLIPAKLDANQTLTIHVAEKPRAVVIAEIKSLSANTGKTMKVGLTSGEHLVGEIQPIDLQLETKFGALAIPATKLSRLTRAP